LAIEDTTDDGAATGGVRQRSRASIERRILEAAESVFAETGFNGATTAEIARRAGIPKANLHYYFNTKDELYQKVLTSIINTWLHTADEITAEADPAPALSHYITAKIEPAQRLGSLLVDQLTAPVRFTQAAGELVRGGVTTFVEIGPGNVLAGLVKRIDRNVRTISVNDLASLEKAKEALAPR